MQLIPIAFLRRHAQAFQRRLEQRAHGRRLLEDFLQIGRPVSHLLIVPAHMRKHGLLAKHLADHDIGDVQELAQGRDLAKNHNLAVENTLT